MRSWEQVAVELMEQNEMLAKLSRELISELAAYRDVEREEQRMIDALKSDIKHIRE